MALAPRLSVLLLSSTLVVACDSDKQSAAEQPTSAAPKPLPKLDTAAAAQAIEALASASEPMKPALAARLFADLEEKRLGESFVDGLQAIEQTEIHQRANHAAKAIAENLSMLNAACEADAAETLTATATMSDDQRAGALWSACEFDRLGLVANDVGKASDPTAMLLAHMAFATLKQAGPLDANERALLEMIARS